MLLSRVLHITLELRATFHSGNKGKQKDECCTHNIHITGDKGKQKELALEVAASTFAMASAMYKMKASNKLTTPNQWGEVR
jgi:hypothetical protein